MTNTLYDNAVFFFATTRCRDEFHRFCQRFSLTTSSAHDIFEVIDHATGAIVHEEAELPAILNWLDLNPGYGFDFYLVDGHDQIFTFSYLRDGYHVMSLPYRLADQDVLAEIIDEFNAIYGWGAGEDTPPPTSINEVKAIVDAMQSPFLRYRNGQFIWPNESPH